MFTSEKEFQSAVCHLARLMGLLTFHTFDSRRSEPGFPDLVIVGRKGFLFREIKTQGGRVRPEQQTWITKLALAKADVAVWRPSDWPERVTAELRAIA